jgi:gluconolactonase
MPVEQLDAKLSSIVSADATIEELGKGYGGDMGPAEGPLWWKEGQYLLFSDIHNDRRMKWAAGEGVSVFQEPNNRANGLTRDMQGRLIACEHDSRRVTRLEPDGSITVVASSYKGPQLNRPNDVVVKSDGSIYFTDPWTLQAPAAQWDLDFAGVYRVSADLGTITMLVGDFVTPNGLAFSPDESILYVNDSRRGHIRSFELLPTGALALGTDHVFCDLRGDRPGIPDGMKVDMQGNVYCGGAGGIWVIDPSGNHLGTIVHGEESTTNLSWGDDDWQTIYFTTRNTLGRVRVNVPGVPVPAPQR